MSIEAKIRNATQYDKLYRVLEVQAVDVKLLNLFDLKKKCKDEWNAIEHEHITFVEGLEEKRTDVLMTQKSLKEAEVLLTGIVSKIKGLVEYQEVVRKADEYNALNHQIVAAQREKQQVTAEISQFTDQLVSLEDDLAALQAEYHKASARYTDGTDILLARMDELNKEGERSLSLRKEVVHHVDSDILAIYEAIFKYKKSAVIVPLEMVGSSASCGGCHLVITQHHESLVRRSEDIIYCEHCGRILYAASSNKNQGRGRRETRKRKLESISEEVADRGE